MLLRFVLLGETFLSTIYGGTIVVLSLFLLARGIQGPFVWTPLHKQPPFFIKTFAPSCSSIIFLMFSAPLSPLFFLGLFYMTGIDLFHGFFSYSGSASQTCRRPLISPSVPPRYRAIRVECPFHSALVYYGMPFVFLNNQSSSLFFPP